MTRLTYILLLLPLLSFGQIDPQVLPLLNEWKNEARANGEWEADRKVAKHLGGIKFVSEQQMILLDKSGSKIVPAGIIGWEVRKGLYNYAFIQPVIFIQEAYRDSEYLKFILWHELWHFLGAKKKDHTANGITGLSINDLWNEKEYWQSIKSLPVNSHWKKSDNTFY